MRSLFIDSDQHTGWAEFGPYFDGATNRLLACGLGLGDVITGVTPSLVVFELPVALRTGGRGKVNANSLILTAARGAYAAGLCNMDRDADVRYVTPEQWKGQLPKEVTMERGLYALTVAEKELILRSLEGVAKSLHNNVWDAIAMGLVWHGRIRGMRIRGSKPLFGGGK